MDDWNETLAVALIVVSLVLMVVAEFAWRRLSGARPDLPMWRFLRRAGVQPAQVADAAGAKAVQQGEIACAICGSQEECLKRLGAQGAAAPPDNCPNAPLFGSFGVRTAPPRR